MPEPPSGPEPKKPPPERLDRLERWMLSAVSHPEGLEAGLASPATRSELSEPIEELIEPSRQLSPTERMAVYADAYYWRLVDTLLEDFPAVEHVLGSERFGRLARAYLAAHPSRHYSLSHLGDHFPGYLVDEAPDEDLPARHFTAQMATLELTITEVFNAKRSPTLSIDDLLRVPAEAWGEARFRLISAARLLEFRYPVNAFYQAWKENPAAVTEVPGEEASRLCIFRRDFRVWRLDLERDHYTLLDGLARGRPLGEALEHCLETTTDDPEALVGSVQSWFQEWTAEGLFSRVETS